jgi:predicted DNA-binding protein YlxM (UPF0122 family)
MTQQRLGAVCDAIKKMDDKLDRYESSCMAYREQCRCARESVLDNHTSKREHALFLLSARIDKIEAKLITMAEDLSFIRGKWDAR